MSKDDNKKPPYQEKHYPSPNFSENKKYSNSNNFYSTDPNPLSPTGATYPHTTLDKIASKAEDQLFLKPAAKPTKPGSNQQTQGQKGAVAKVHGQPPVPYTTNPDDDLIQREVHNDRLDPKLLDVLGGEFVDPDNPT